MNKTILIDAAQADETRIAVIKNGKIDDFDIEADDHAQLRGNIYLGKVTRVEPSLQAAFVEYGGNRQGFLAFDEIHPDYYQIPQADRDALQAEVEAAMAERPDNENDRDEDESPQEEGAGDELEAGDAEDASDAEEDASLGAGDAEVEEARELGKRLKRKLSNRYKIQEVIKTRQVILVQVVKGERGNKGAALTTYLSLAGRCCVLMPNSVRGGGVSRKIGSVAARRRLKKILTGLDVPVGMGLIVRTAGAQRSGEEIGNDYEYLMRLWSRIRERTFESVAPCLVHEESDLILRTVRDIYDHDVEAVHVAGEETCAEVEGFFDQMIPDQKDRIRQHNEADGPLFAAHGVEAQLDELYQARVPLPSGGYMVIQQTEALVSIDVNSGKATRERSIETTAVRTNEEAALEAARQIRLRDLAGLIVIDFIDMDESRNSRAIERRMKDALASDRARVHMGRISRFGLMEISRQRRRIGVAEVSSESCAVCAGTGRVRSTPSVARKIVRELRERLPGVSADHVIVEAAGEVAMHLLNRRRAELAGLEQEFGVPIVVIVSSDSAERFGLFKMIRDRRSELMAPRRKARRTRRADGEAVRTRAAPRGARRENGETEAAAEEVQPRDKPSRARGGRRRGGRRRTPEVAIDGAERLEAIASAPFLEINGGTDPVIVAEPEMQTAPATPPAPEAASNDIAPVDPAPVAEQGSAPGDVAPVDPAPVAEQGSVPEASEKDKKVPDLTLHPLHAPVADPAPETTRKKGWWSRRLGE